jgi:hypothetical protein
VLVPKRRASSHHVSAEPALDAAQL